jgi:hypothetical protein
VGRNVATLVDNPKGQVGRPSRSFILEQSLALLEAAQESRLNAYVVLSLATGIRTEEARELTGITSTWTGSGRGPPCPAVGSRVVLGTRRR